MHANLLDFQENFTFNCALSQLGDKKTHKNRIVNWKCWDAAAATILFVVFILETFHVNIQ